MQAVWEVITICLLNSSSACFLFCKKMNDHCAWNCWWEEKQQNKLKHCIPLHQNKTKQKTQTKINKDKKQNWNKNQHEQKQQKQWIKIITVPSLTKLWLKTSCVTYKHSYTYIKTEIWLRIKPTTPNKNTPSRRTENTPLINTPQIPWWKMNAPFPPGSPFWSLLLLLLPLLSVCLSVCLFVFILLVKQRNKSSSTFVTCSCTANAKYQEFIWKGGQSRK